MKGRYGFDDYPDAAITNIEVGDKFEGDTCTCCGRGRLYYGTQRKLLEFTANSPVSVHRYTKESLRCNACNKEYMSNRQIYKWNNSARSSIMLQKVSGMPFYRLSKLQSMYGVPIAPSTLWKQCFDFWLECGRYIYEELALRLAQSNKLYSDDTGVKILQVTYENKALSQKERRGCNTTVICGEVEDSKEIILYVSNDKYCAKNLGHVLENRQNKEESIKLMVDASSRSNLALDGLEIVISNCLTHGRRKFYELLGFYVEECSYFLQEIREIYINEERCKNLSVSERLFYHREHSLWHINNIYNKIASLFRERVIEPNSALGKAMRYWIRHKKKLIRFLQVEGVALDNNYSERALKDIILQRKNSLFFKTLGSAEVLSGINSIVKTCTENGINAFNYLNWIQENWKKVQRSAAGFLPWRYNNNLGPPILS